MTLCCYIYLLYLFIEFHRIGDKQMKIDRLIGIITILLQNNLW